jgi:outer membrane protein OmpA-like peptidoglycan-associated protein
MRASTLGLFAIVLLSLLTEAALAGDRLGVVGAIHSLPVHWTDALFSIDVDGLSKDGEAILDQPLKVEHEAAMPGYTTYLRVTSHGEMKLFRYVTAAGSAKGSDSYAVMPPLGGEEIVVLFSSAPLDEFFADNANSQDLGSDRASAEAFARRLAQMEAGGIKLTSRRFGYLVTTAVGGTEYTTRSIIRRVEEAPRQPLQGGAVAKIPSRVEFEFDSDRLTEQGKRDLDIFGEALVSRLHDRPVALEGHTDAIGTDDYNLSLSLRRSEAAREYLVKSFGIPESKLSVVGKGKAEPVAPNSSEAERAHNRRVDFVFFDAQPPGNH